MPADRSDNLGLVPILRIAGEVFLGQFSGGRMLSGELIANEGVLRHYFPFALSPRCADCKSARCRPIIRARNLPIS
jgi:hypothetical protein